MSNDKEPAATVSQADYLIERICYDISAGSMAVWRTFDEVRHAFVLPFLQQCGGLLRIFVSVTLSQHEVLCALCFADPRDLKAVR